MHTQPTGIIIHVLMYSIGTQIRVALKNKHFFNVIVTPEGLNSLIQVNVKSFITILTELNALKHLQQQTCLLVQGLCV